MSVTIEVPDDLARKLEADPKAAEAELLLELAIALYAKGELSATSAGRVAGISRWDFEEILRVRKVAMPYMLGDLEHDMAYANRHR